MFQFYNYFFADPLALALTAVVSVVVTVLITLVTVYLCRRYVLIQLCNRLYECVHVYKELEMQSVHFWPNAVNA